MDKLENKKIAVIGFGHMGTALFKGLIKSGKVRADRIIISSPTYNDLTKLKKKYKVNVTRFNIEAAIFADWIFIAVKPFVVSKIIQEIKNVINGKIILSIAAAVEIKTLEDYVNNSHQKIIRLMPNIPVACNKGVIGLYTNKNVKSDEKNQVVKLLDNLGEVIKVEREEDIDTLTLLSACGPAIVAYFIDLLSNYGETRGFSKNLSLRIALKTFEGTFRYLNSNQLTPSLLRQSVATKGGITEAILKSLERKKFRKKFAECMAKGYSKILEVKKKFM